MCKSIINLVKRWKLKKKKKKSKRHPSKVIVQLTENKWFKKKIEKELGTKIIDNVPLTALAKALRRKAGRHRKKHVKPTYYEPPQTADNPDINWKGPLLKTCFCISSMDHCDCKGRMVLPANFIPYAKPNKLLPWLRCVRRLPYFKKKRYDELHKLDEPLAVRLQEHLEIEEEVFKTLNTMNIDQGFEFCVMRCNHYYSPLGEGSDLYFKTKRDLYRDIKKERDDAKLALPRPVATTYVTTGGPKVSASYTEGLCHSGATQPTFDKDGKLIYGKYSHFLFGKTTRFQDVEGKNLCVLSYQKINKPPKQPQSVIQQVENKLNRIKAKVSKLTFDFVTTIIDIKDPGIPTCTRATQDPPLDDEYESVILPSKYKCVKELEKELCLCQKAYEATHYYYPELAANEVDKCMNLKEDVASKESCCCLPDLLLSEIIEEKEDLRSCDDKSFDIKGGLYSPLICEDDLDDEDSENIDKVQNDDKKKLIEKVFVVVDENNINEKESKQEITTIDQIVSKDIKITLEGLTKTNEGNDDIDDFKKESKNIAFRHINAHQPESTVHTESTEPIEKLCNHLEKNVAVDKYVVTLLEETLFSVIDRNTDLLKRKQEQQLAIEQQKSSGEGINNKIKDFFLKVIVDTVLANFKSDNNENETKNDETIDLNQLLKPNSNINKFSEFMKKQKSSLKKIFKTNTAESSPSPTKRALSMENAKLNINKSFKKAKSTLWPLFKYRREKSSVEMKDLLNLKKKSENINKLDDKSKENLEGRVDSGQNVPESKTSEKEVFSVQYYSSLDMSDNNK